MQHDSYADYATATRERICFLSKIYDVKSHKGGGGGGGNMNYYLFYLNIYLTRIN